MDKLKYVKLENEDGTYSSPIPLAVDSDYVDVDGKTLTNELNKKATKEEVSIIASGSPAGVYATVSDLTTADPDHNRIYVITANGHWYYYNSGWQDGGVYLSTENNNKIDNLINIDLSWTEGYYLDSSGMAVAKTGWKYSNFIGCASEDGGISLPIILRAKTVNNVPVVGYDANYHFLGYIRLTESESLEIVTKEISNFDFKYIRFSVYNYNDAIAYYTDISNIRVATVDGRLIKYKSIDKDKVDFIKPDSRSNLINREDLQNGYIASDGIVHNDSYLYCSNYIGVEPNINYYTNALINQYWAFYDEYLNFVAGQSTEGNLSNPFTVPEGVKFIRVTIHTNDLNACWICPDNKGPKMDYDLVLDDKIDIFGKLCDYTKNDNITTFNKILCVGDSLTSGTFNYKQDGSTAHYVVYSKYSYPTYLNKLTNCEVTNNGDGGASIESYWSRHQNENWSGHDLAIIELGTNNQTWGETQEEALTNIINKIKEENENIFIFVSSTLPAASYSHSWYEAINQGIEELVNGLHDSHVIFINLKKFGHTNDSMAYNCGHLSAYGYYRLAKDYSNFISYYMDQNPLLFREIQFIGTEYHYQ